MPPAYTSAQKLAISQFVGITKVKDGTAAKVLKSMGWNVDHAVNAFYADPSNAGPVRPLNKLFDSYRDEEGPDTIGTAGTMQYLNALQVELDEPAVLAILTEVGAPTMGELSRDPFVAGWKMHSADTIGKQKAKVAEFRTLLQTYPDYFRRVYKHTFFLARQPGQKAVGLDIAIDFWRLLFSKRGMPWQDARTDWLELYVAFLEQKWRKTVSRDMWDQTGVFAAKCMEDGSLAWWSEDGAWPGVLDDFVAYVLEIREREGGAPESMDTE